MGRVVARRGDVREVRVGEILLVLGSALLLAASWFVVVAADTVPVWEEWLFSAINGLPDFLWQWCGCRCSSGASSGRSPSSLWSGS